MQHQRFKIVDEKNNTVFNLSIIGISHLDCQHTLRLWMYKHAGTGEKAIPIHSMDKDEVVVSEEAKKIPL